MKILVYGAGVVGSYFAARLKEKGHRVSILARSKRLLQILEHGIVLEDALTGRRTVTGLDAVERLASRDVYDLVIAAVRKNQVKEILPVLAGQRSRPPVVFMVNNAAGPDEYTKALGSDRVFLSFSAIGGIREEHVIRYVSGKKPVIPLGGSNGNRQPPAGAVIRVFRQADIKIKWFRNMDAWLKYHVALVSPIANALLLAGDNYRLARDREMVMLMLRAIKEGFAVVKALGYPLTPRKSALIKWLPEYWLTRLMQKRLHSKAAEIALAGHALNAVDEMKHLSAEFQTLVEQAELHSPAILQLHRGITIL